MIVRRWWRESSAPAGREETQARSVAVVIVVMVMIAIMVAVGMAPIPVRLLVVAIESVEVTVLAMMFRFPLAIVHIFVSVPVMIVVVVGVIHSVTVLLRTSNAEQQRYTENKRTEVSQQSTQVPLLSKTSMLVAMPKARVASRP
jgi:hypothetical protein